MRARAVAAAAALAVASCATAPPAPPPEAGALAMDQLPGWAEEDHAAAFQLLRQVCRETPRPARVCGDAARLGSLDDASARRFLEARFQATEVAGAGVLTAYFTPAYEARSRPDAVFSAPVRPAPLDPTAAPDRGDIEHSPAPDALAWMRPEDLFFLQIQGSGDLAFADGRRARAAFAGSNGRQFVAIAGPMVAKGLIAPRDASASGVRAWLAAHRGPEADAVMRLDPRYVFFRLTDGTSEPPRGAAGAPLIAGRSLAVDPAAHPYFELLWIDAGSPTLSGARRSYQRLAAALDAGGAIRGAARADLYLGLGPSAGEEAAVVRHALRLYRVTPREADR